MDRLILFASPTRMGKITVYKDDAVKEVVAVTAKDLPAVALTLAKQYKIKCIDITGPINYTKKIGEELAHLNKTQYKKMQLSIEYVKGV